MVLGTIVKDTVQVFKDFGYDYFDLSTFAGKPIEKFYNMWDSFGVSSGADVYMKLGYVENCTPEQEGSNDPLDNGRIYLIIIEYDNEHYIFDFTEGQDAAFKFYNNVLNENMVSH